LLGFGLDRPQSRTTGVASSSSHADDLHSKVDHMGCNPSRICCLALGQIQSDITVCAFKPHATRRNSIHTPRASRAATWEAARESQDGAFRSLVRWSSLGCESRRVCMMIQDHRQGSCGVVRQSRTSRSHRIASPICRAIMAMSLKQRASWQLHPDWDDNSSTGILLAPRLSRYAWPRVMLGNGQSLCGGSLQPFSQPFSPTQPHAHSQSTLADYAWNQ
jgi:hypothetical protein